MSQKQTKKETKLTKYLKAPIRILIKARDFYIKSMTECSDRISYGHIMGCPTGHIQTLPRSFSVSSTKSRSGDDDYRELIRAASTRSLGNRMEADFFRREQIESPKKTPPPPFNVPRSSSVRIGRIDEDKPCEFVDDVKVKKSLFPRSRSYAAGKSYGAGKRKGAVF